MKVWKKISRQLIASGLALTLAFAGTGTQSLASAAAQGSLSDFSGENQKKEGAGKKEASESDALKKEEEEKEQNASKTSNKGEKAQLFQTSWDLVTGGGTLLDEKGTSVTQLQKNKGSFTNEDGVKLEIDASSGKFAVQDTRTQVNSGTKISVPAEGDVCFLTIEAHKYWRGNDDSVSQKEKEANALATAGITGVKTAVVEDIETSLEDSNYEIYTYRCVMENGADAVTLNVKADRSMYITHIAADCREYASVLVEGDVILEEETDSIEDSVHVVLENEKTGETFKGTIENDGDQHTYKAEVKVAKESSFLITLDKENYVVTGENRIFLSEDSGDFWHDLTVSKSKLKTVKGTVKGFDDTFHTSELSIEFIPQRATEYIPEAEMNGRDYTVLLEPGIPYALKLKGADDYKILQPEGTVTVTESETLDIFVSQKEIYPITIQWPDEVDLSDLALQFVYTDEDGKQEVFDSQSEIRLKEGTYTLSLDGEFDQVPWMISGGQRITVNGPVTQKIRLKEVTSWSLYNDGTDSYFSGSLEGETGYYRGLKIDAAEGKLALRSDGLGSQFNANTKIHVPVTGDCIIAVEAQQRGYAFYTINGQAADQDSEITTVNYTGEAGYIDIAATGTSYIKSISLIYPAPEVPIHKQEVMPETAQWGSPDNLTVSPYGQTITFTQAGGSMSGKEAISHTVSYYLFPETDQWQTISADIAIEKGSTSTSSGVFFGAFDGTCMTTLGIRGMNQIRGIYSKNESEHVGAGGPNTSMEQGGTLSV